MTMTYIQLGILLGLAFTVGWVLSGNYHLAKHIKELQQIRDWLRRLQ